MQLARVKNSNLFWSMEHILKCQANEIYYFCNKRCWLWSHLNTYSSEMREERPFCSFTQLVVWNSVWWLWMTGVLIPNWFDLGMNSLQKTWLLSFLKNSRLHKLLHHTRNYLYLERKRKLQSSLYVPLGHRDGEYIIIN